MRNSSGCRTAARSAMAIVGAVSLWSAAASAETIESALVRAYQDNPQLNAQRAAARAVDEEVPQALSGYRPKLAITASGGEQYSDTTSKNVVSVPGQQTIVRYGRTSSTQTPYSVGATATQMLFDGFQTPNRTRAAESQVAAAREALRVMEQSVLLAGATIYMDVRRDMENLAVQRDNVHALEQTLHQTRERLAASDVTATDVAQADAQLAAGRSALLQAQATLETSKATYRQVIGVDPADLTPAAPVDRLSPSALPQAIDRAVLENPNVLAAMHGVDVSYLQVKINEGALFPTLALQASVQHSNSPQFGIVQETSAAVLGQLTIPIYQGGAEYSLIRQSKETLAQQRLTLDVVRNQARQNVVQAWSQLQASKSQLDAAVVQVTAAKKALDGISQEALVGQRTTFDVLNAQQVVVNARVAQLVAEHDRVVSSYNLLAAVGRLSPEVLGLPTAIYDPILHYHEVRDAWFGVRTPDGSHGGFATSEARPAPQHVATAQEGAHAPGSAPTTTPTKVASVGAAQTPLPRPKSPRTSKSRVASATHGKTRSAPQQQSPQRTAQPPAAPPRTARSVSPPAPVAASTSPAERFSTENNSGLLPPDGSPLLFSGTQNSGVLSGAQPVVPNSGFVTSALR